MSLESKIMSLNLVRNGQTKVETFSLSQNEIFEISYPVSHIFVLRGHENLKLFINGVTGGKVCLTGIEYEFASEHQQIYFKNEGGSALEFKILISYGDKSRFWQGNPDGNGIANTYNVSAANNFVYSSNPGLTGMTLICPKNPRRKYVDINLKWAKYNAAAPYTYAQFLLGSVVAAQDGYTNTQADALELFAGTDGFSYLGLGGELMTARQSVGSGLNTNVPFPQFTTNHIIPSSVRLFSQSDIWGVIAVSPYFTGGADWDYTTYQDGDCTGEFQVTELEY